MRVVIDIRKARIRAGERLLIDVTDEVSGRTVSLAPMPTDSAFDNLQVILLDMLDRNRDSSAQPCLRPDSEAPTALIPKPPPQ